MGGGSARAEQVLEGELLEADRHGTTFLLDLKGRSRSTATAVVRLLHDVVPHRPVLACGRHWASVEVAATLPYVQAVLSARTRGELARLRRRLAEGAPVHGVSVHRTLLDPEVVAELHRHVRIVMTWPVNDVTRLDAALAVGVTGVISDEPSVLSELLRRRASSTPP